MAKCSVDGCENEARQQGWCWTHRTRWVKTGDVQADKPIRPRIVGDDAARFASRVVASPTGCLLWTGAMSKGYGQFVVKPSRKVQAHRWAFEQANGPIDPGMDLDHLCRTPACVNPAHLEAVSHRENVRRGTSPSASAAKRTHCPQGHPYSGENLYVTRAGVRHCRECNRISCREAYLKRKARA